MESGPVFGAKTLSIMTLSITTLGRGKLTYTFSANANVLSISAAYPPPPRLTHPPPPAGNTLNGLSGKRNVTENIYVVLPGPNNIQQNKIRHASLCVGVKKCGPMFNKGVSILSLI